MTASLASQTHSSKGSTEQPGGPSISILMCTFNGARFLDEQLNSLAGQSYKNWSLHVSDDGSTDGTIEILERFRSSLPQHTVTIYSGPRKGFAENFISLAQRSGPASDYYAFCDQDDVWHSTKLQRNLQAFSGRCAEIPAMCYSRTRLINVDGAEIAYSREAGRPAAFRNSLVENIASGNTIFFNKSALQLIRCIPSTQPIIAHDWLLYLVISACQGLIVYDPFPTVDYRQHDHNLIGGRRPLISRFRGLINVSDSRYKQWNEHNIEALDYILPLMPEVNRATFEAFKSARTAPLPQRLLMLKRSGVYRQTASGNAILYIAALLNKI
jgi:glycosyltransferase involved in cell wall biosynthesis